MPPLIFQCLVTGFDIQGLVPKDIVGAQTVWVPVDCPICNRPHLVNPATGRSLGQTEKPNDK